MDPKNKKTILHFYRYLCHLKVAYDMQHEFPEYFVPVIPNWYRRLHGAQMNIQKALNDRRTYKYCAKAIDEIREKYKKEGRAWRHVAAANRSNEENIRRSEERIEICKKEYDSILINFLRDEELSISIKSGFVKSREFGFVVAQRDYDAFMLQEGEYAEESRIAKMRLYVDKATLALLEARNSLFYAENKKVRDADARNWKKLIKVQKIKEYCCDEGLILGRLLVLQEIWEEFVNELGGVQYVFDLTGEKRKFYQETKAEVTSLLQRRRELRAMCAKKLSINSTRRQTTHTMRASMLPPQRGTHPQTWRSPQKKTRTRSVGVETQISRGKKNVLPSA